MSAEILRQVWLFSGLSRDQLDALSSFTFQKTFYPGDLIVEEGRTGNGCYVVMSGEVEVVKGLGTQGEKVLAQRGAGEVFGKMALLAGCGRKVRRSAAAYGASTVSAAFGM